MTKLEIYGTFGPSCNNKETIKQMLEIGMTGLRLNLSHCNLSDKEDWINNLLKASQELGIQPDFLIDLKGPELRLPKTDEIEYLPNDSFICFSTLHWPKEIMENACVNDTLLIDDGKLSLNIEKIHGLFIDCRVIVGGYLYGGKSITIKGKNITSKLLQDDDIKNIRDAKKYNVTGIMQPFVRSANDLITLKQILKENNASDIKIYAKIENIEGVKHLEELLPHCDHIVIARGDLANSVGLTKLPVIQKQIEDCCKKHHKPYMVVTEMLASMQEKQVPTRAEVSDIFHAVYIGASSIMLTGETANGKYPIDAMKYFVETAKEAINLK